MQHWFLTISPPAWEDIGFFLLAIYLFFVFLKQSFKRAHELRAICLVTAMAVIPLLMGLHYLAGWDLSEEAEFNQLGNWWIAPIEDIEKTADGVEIINEKPFNLITFGLYLCLLYIGATLAVWLLSCYFLLRRGTRLLAIRKLLIKLAVLLLGVIIYLKSEGIDLTPLWVGMGAASVIVGIALQEPLSSLFKGVALDMEGVFHRGEWIRVGGKSGVAGLVVDKNWRTTKIMTIDDELITIPNSVLGSEQILNYNQPDAAHVHRLHVGTSYNDPPVKVKEILRTILIREPRIERNPPPAIRTIKYNDFSIDYEMKFWIRDYAQHPTIKDRVMTQVWYAFKYYGIEIPFPIRTVHMKEQEHLREEARGIDTRVSDVNGFLRTLPFFNAHLNTKDFEFLARNAFQRQYAPGEHVIHRGEMGDALYIVRKGWCEVVLPNGERRRIESGDFFGEMGLIALIPRTADVVAGQETGTTIRIDRECMLILFKRYPNLKNEFERMRDTRMEDSGFMVGPEESKMTPLIVRLFMGIKDFILPW